MASQLVGERGAILVEPGHLDAALRKLGKLYGRGYLALHDADSRRFVSRQDRERLRRSRAELRRKRQQKQRKGA